MSVLRPRPSPTPKGLRCSNIWVCRSGNEGPKGIRTHGHNRQDCQGPEIAEGQEGRQDQAALPAQEPLSPLRAAAGILAQVWSLPDLFSPTGPRRGDPGRDQGELVAGREMRG